MGSRFRRLWNQVITFSEKQGFPVIVTICIGIITASAIWSVPASDDYAAATPPVNHDISAAQLLQESIRDAMTATPAPTVLLPQWCPPLDEICIITPYSTTRMVQCNKTGLWQVHAGVDLAADPGSPVYAIADGIVIAHGNDSLLGTWLRVSHGDAEALYAGMARTADYITGDKMDMHDIIGYVGNEAMNEQHLGPHLHLEVMKEGIPVDPISLWNNH